MRRLSRDGSLLDEKWNAGVFRPPALCPVESSKRTEVHMSRAFISVVAAILFFPCTPAVSAQTPARDKPDPTGTAVIRGRIVDAVSGEPVRKARVRASSSVLQNARTATTDVNG